MRHFFFLVGLTLALTPAFGFDTNTTIVVSEHDTIVTLTTPERVPGLAELLGEYDVSDPNDTDRVADFLTRILPLAEWGLDRVAVWHSVLNGQTLEIRANIGHEPASITIFIVKDELIVVVGWEQSDGAMDEIVPLRILVNATGDRGDQSASPPDHRLMYLEMTGSCKCSHKKGNSCTNENCEDGSSCGNGETNGAASCGFYTLVQ